MVLVRVVRSGSENEVRPDFQRYVLQDLLGFGPQSREAAVREMSLHDPGVRIDGSGRRCRFLGSIRRSGQDDIGQGEATLSECEKRSAATDLDVVRVGTKADDLEWTR
jgi:hypothetical protein